MTKKQITYLGISTPSTPQEIAVEITGLKTAIKTAEELISRLEQALAIAELAKAEKTRELAKSEKITEKSDVQTTEINPKSEATE